MTLPLLALVLAQSIVIGNPDGPIISQPSLMGGMAYFEAWPENARGLPVVQGLCDQLASSEKVGNWFCLKEDGTMATGSTVTLTAANSPTTVSVPVCPNGPDCASVTAKRMNGTNQKFEGTAQAIDNDFTVCSLFRFDSYTTQLLMNKTGFGGNAVVQMYVVSSGVANFDVYTSTPTSTTINTGIPMLIGEHHFICGTYHYVGSGTSVQRIFSDGSPGGVTNAVGPPNPASLAWAAGYSQYVNNQYFGGLMRGSFYIGTALSDARIAAISRAVLADTPTGAKGETMTYARTSGQKWCWNSTTGYGSWVPAGRPCIGNGGAFLSEKAGINLLLRHEEIDNAVYTKDGTAVVTANDAGTPWDTITADVLHTDATSGAGFNTVYQTANASGANPFTCSVLAAGARPADGGVPAAGTTDLCGYDGAAWTCTACTYTAWPTYTLCAHTDLTTTVATRYCKIGNNSAQNGGVARSIQDIAITGFQMEEQAYPTSRMSSGAVQFARVRDAASFTGTGAMACQSYQVNVPGFQAVSTQQRFGSVIYDGSNYLDHYINITGTSNAHFTYLGASIRTAGTVVPAIATNTWTTATFRQTQAGASLITDINGSTTTTGTTAHTIPSAAWTVYPGAYQTGTFELNGWLRRLQLDPNYTRCRK